MAYESGQIQGAVCLLVTAIERSFPKLVTEIIGMGLSTLYARATRSMEAQQDQHVLTYTQTSPRKFGHASQVLSSRILSQTLRRQTGQLYSPETARRHLYGLRTRIRWLSRSWRDLPR